MDYRRLIILAALAGCNLSDGGRPVPAQNESADTGPQTVLGVIMPDDVRRQLEEGPEKLPRVDLSALPLEPLDNAVSVKIDDLTFGEAMGLLNTITGITYEYLTGEGVAIDRRRVSLHVNGVSPETAVNWLARLARVNVKWTTPGNVIVSTAYPWFEEAAPVERFYDLDDFVAAPFKRGELSGSQQVVGPGGRPSAPESGIASPSESPDSRNTRQEDFTDVKRMMQTVLRVPLRYGMQKFSVSEALIRDKIVIRVVAPDDGHLRLDTFFNLLRQVRNRADEHPFAKRDIGKIKFTPTAGEIPLDELIHEIGVRTGVNIGYAPDDKTRSKRIKLPAAETRIDPLLGLLVSRFEFTAALYDERDVWLLGNEKELAWGENLFDRAEIRAIFASDLVDRFSRSLLLKEIRENVFPGTWQDNACMLDYHRLTGSLVVINDGAVVDRVEEFIGTIRKIK